MTPEEKRAAQRVRYQRWLARHPEKRAEINERARNWRKANPERQAAAVKEWISANRDKMNASARRYKERNKEKVRAETAEWREKNKAHISAYGKKKWRSRTAEQIDEYRMRDRERCAKRRAKDPEKFRETRRKWYRNNVILAKERHRQWRKNNPEILRAARHRRRAKDQGFFTNADIAQIRKAQKGRCGYCRTRLTTSNEHIDHIVALANGGTNHRSNIQLLCAPCNQRKSKRDPIEFAQSMGMLI